MLDLPLLYHLIFDKIFDQNWKYSCQREIQFFLWEGCIELKHKQRSIFKISITEFFGILVETPRIKKQKYIHYLIEQFSWFHEIKRIFHNIFKSERNLDQNFLKKDPERPRNLSGFVHWSQYKVSKKSNELMRIISKVDMRNMKQYSAIASKLYELRKTHKTNLSFRPVVSCINSPAYILAVFLHNILFYVRIKKRGACRIMTTHTRY